VIPSKVHKFGGARASARIRHRYLHAARLSRSGELGWGHEKMRVAMVVGIVVVVDNGRESDFHRPDPLGDPEC